MLEFVDRDLLELDMYMMDKIIGHRHANSGWQLLIKWAGYDAPSWEPLSDIAKDDFVSVALYAKENDLLLQ